MEVELTISKDGQTVTMLYYDDFPLNKLGKPSIVRASNVQFDNEKKLWFVHELFGNEVEKKHEEGFKRRADAIKSEIDMLEKRLAVDPASVDAMFEKEKPQGKQGENLGAFG